MAFGRFERSEGPRPISDINVTPMVDVMLVLVVILIITAPLMASSLRLELPQTGSAQPAEAQRFVSVGIDPAGQLFLDDKPVSAEQLARGLAQAAAGSRDTEVQLRADRSVPYGKVVQVMGAAREAGLSRIGFVAVAGDE